MSKYTAEQVAEYRKYLVSIGASSELIDYVDDYIALLLERESAKAGVSDDDICDAMTVMFGNHWKPHTDEYSRMRAVLEDFASTLASARVPDGWQLVPKKMDANMLREFRRVAGAVIGMHAACMGYIAALAAAPKHGE